APGRASGRTILAATVRLSPRQPASQGAGAQPGTLAVFVGPVVSHGRGASRGRAGDLDRLVMAKEETFGRTRGTVGRPRHNGVKPWHGRETVPQQRWCRSP